MEPAGEVGGRQKPGSVSRIFAALLILAGVPIAIGGAWLLSLGGSVYYAACGAGYVVSAILLWRRSRWSAILFVGLLLATFAWALIDGALDFWILLSRLGFPLLSGCGFLLPAVRRDLVGGPGVDHGARWATAVTLALLLATASVGWLRGDPFAVETHDTYPQRIASGFATGGDWQAYGNDPGGTRYSPLAQLDPSTVAKLAVAWTYRTGDYPPPQGHIRRLEVTPIKVGDRLYLCSARSKIIALDAETGRPVWTFDPKVDIAHVEPSSACRGVAYFRRPLLPGAPLAPRPCDERILEATVDSRLIAVDAATGRRCPGFGANGEVDLKRGLGAVIPAYVSVSSAPVTIAGKVVVNSRIADGQFVGEPGGVIRAYDAITGAPAWAFDPGNPADQRFPVDGGQFVRGTTNSWAPMSVDPALDLIYVPTGVATPDYWGRHRTPLDERYGSAVIALDAATGKERWVFQTTHHDIWDYDVASQPSLVDLPIDGRRVPALLQPTKRGQLFLLDRRTGRPLADVIERAVPQGAAPGEQPSRTQPFSVGMPAVDGLPLSESDMWGLTPYDALWCRIRFRQAHWEGTLTPPSLGFYLTFPSALGGVNWGSATIDPDRGIAYVPWNRMILRGRLVARPQADRMGLKPMGPTGFIGGVVAQAGTPYASMIGPFSAPLTGVPCNAPPYGNVSAIDLRSRKILWTKRVGLAAKSRLAGMRVPVPVRMGVPLMGGSLATRGGLLFLGATGDNRLRAFDARSGRVLWSAVLPAAANATPMSYSAPRSGRQMVVVAAGGHPMLDTVPGDYVIAFALPQARSR